MRFNIFIIFASAYMYIYATTTVNDYCVRVFDVEVCVHTFYFNIYMQIWVHAVQKVCGKVRLSAYLFSDDDLVRNMAGPMR